MQRFRRQTQLLLPWVYFQKCLQILHKLRRLYSHMGEKNEIKHLVVMPACCFLLAKLCLFEIEGTSAWNWIAACLQPRRCPGKATNCCDGQAAIAVYCFRARTNKGKKTKKQNGIKKCSSVSQLNKRGGEDRKGTVGGPKSYCQYKTLSRPHKFKIKKENGMKKIVEKSIFPSAIKPSVELNNCFFPTV